MFPTVWISSEDSPILRLKLWIALIEANASH
jgi:hypothetical protein